ncbi:unnamed protein product [Leptidea sinapis]|uniref:ABC transmembrane type-1 domain-containing protein n=1 Tax=Leptidea sinapis TaxID=189913 RepID=A0A5E4PN24_9NEOP|nr:unnamed protein product [Leptidea sinapis]
MKRDDSVKSFSRYNSTQRPALTLGFRSNSLTISSLAQQSAFLAEKARNEPDDPNLQAPATSWFRLFRFATTWELLLLFLGVIFASLNGLMVPVGVIGYGEFTALLIDRTVMNGTSTKTWAISMFGGGRILKNASASENRLALIEDSQAFGLCCFVFSLMQFVFGVVSVDLFNYTALKQIERLKERFLKAVIRQDITWYDLNTSMNFATKVSDDVEKYREGISEKVPMLVYLIMSFVTAVIISFAYGWELTLVILSCAPVIIATTAVVAKIQSSLTTQELKAYSVAGVIAEEVLSAIRTVAAFGGEEKEIARYSKRLEPAQNMGIRKGVFSGIGSGIMWFIIYATYALSFWYGVGLILDCRRDPVPAYTPAVLMIIFFSVLQGAQNVGLTAPHLEAMANARASAGSIFAVMDRKPQIDSLSTEGARPELTGDLQLKNVYFKYPARPDVQVLNGINLVIKQNETVALVGSSGCGKSTVLQLIQRMYDPDSGLVTVSGNDLRNLNVRHYRNHIAVVGQEPVLFAGSIKENIRMSNPSCTDEEIINAAKQAYCHSFIKKLPERGAVVWRTKAAHSYCSCACTAAEDTAAGRGDLGPGLSQRGPATVLNATRIVFIDKGEVAEEGTHEELLRLKGHYYQLLRTQIQKQNCVR